MRRRLCHGITRSKVKLWPVVKFIIKFISTKGTLPRQQHHRVDITHLCVSIINTLVVNKNDRPTFKYLHKLFYFRSVCTSNKHDVILIYYQMRFVFINIFFFFCYHNCVWPASFVCISLFINFDCILWTSTVLSTEQHISKSDSSLWCTFLITLRPPHITRKSLFKIAKSQLVMLWIN